MEIRKFQENDAEFCFKTRATAFVQEFYQELGAKIVTAGINAYMPADYIKLAATMPTFIAEEDGHKLGFITIKILDGTTAEILLVYVDLREHNRGIGRKLVQHAEEWIRENHPKIETMVVDTGIPRLNKLFYEKVGYVVIGESEIPFPDGPVKAVRLGSKLK